MTMRQPPQLIAQWVSRCLGQVSRGAAQPRPASFNEFPGTLFGHGMVLPTGHGIVGEPETFMPKPEPWPQIYRDAPEIFEAFGQAEDPEGLIAGRVQALAGLAGKRVLEIGCGTGRYSGAWAEHATGYVALEPSPKMLGLARTSCEDSGVHLVRGRGEGLPFRDESFDRVVATWVLAYLRPEACRRVLGEAERVFRKGGGGGIWLVENHWTGDFQALRRREGLGGEPGVARLLEAHGFEAVEVVKTELRFPSALEAERILGALCGPDVAERLRRRPTSRLGHNVVILHRPVS